MSFRLLVISSAFPPFKAPESAHTLLVSRRLAQRGLDVHVLTTRGNRSSPVRSPVFTAHPVMADWSWGSLPQLVRSFWKIRPDAVLLIYIDWIYGCHPMIAFAPTITRWLRPKVHFVTHFANENGLTATSYHAGLLGRLVRHFAGWLAGSPGLHASYGTLLRDSNAIIAQSDRHLDAFESAHPGVRAKTFLIPAPPLLELSEDDVEGAARRLGRQLLAISEAEIVFVFFGYIYPLKDMETLISAFSRLPSYTRLLIVGEGAADYVDRLVEQSRKEGRAEHIRWLGHCDDQVASQYLSASDVCVLPFHSGVRLNNSSFAVAAAHGLPIITTRGDSLEAPFRDGDNVRLCPPKDVSALLAAMLDLSEHPIERVRLRAGALRLAEQCFSWNSILDSTLLALGYLETDHGTVVSM